jgi:hypothetical protein
MKLYPQVSKFLDEEMPKVSIAILQADFRLRKKIELKVHHLIVVNLKLGDPINQSELLETVQDLQRDGIYDIP